MPFIDKEAFASGHVPFPNGGVGRTGYHESVEHPNTIDVARVTPVRKKVNGFQVLNSLFMKEYPRVNA